MKLIGALAGLLMVLAPLVFYSLMGYILLHFVVKYW